METETKEEIEERLEEKSTTFRVIVIVLGITFPALFIGKYFGYYPKAGFSFSSFLLYTYLDREYIKDISRWFILDINESFHGEEFEITKGGEK